MSGQTPIDWTDIKRRVEAAGRALESWSMPTAETARSTLDTRARALARPLTEQRIDPTLALITFSMNGELNALAASDVIEIRRRFQITALPGTRAPVTGLTVWRGDLLTVLDLRRTPETLDAAILAEWMVVAGHAQVRFGLIVDAVRDFRHVRLADLHSPAQPHAGYVRAVTQDPISLLDAEQLVRLYR